MSFKLPWPADGPVAADWLACTLKRQPAAVVVLAAWFSGARDQALHSMAETISQAGITCIRMWAEILDPAAVVYTIEFVRAYATGAPVQVAYRVALEQLALEHPGQGYLRYLARFEDWRAGRPMTKGLVEAYATQLEQAGRSPTTINRKLAAVRWWARRLADLAEDVLAMPSDLKR